MPTPSEINDALVALSVLLVFVIAYFSAIFPIVQQKREEDVHLRPLAYRRGARRGLAVYEGLTGGILALSALIALLISKDSYEIAKHPSRWWPWCHQFVMIYGALMLVMLFVTVFIAVLAVSIGLIDNSRRNISVAAQVPN